jgi:hypothetical protein
MNIESMTRNILKVEISYNAGDARIFGQQADIVFVHIFQLKS